MIFNINSTRGHTGSLLVFLKSTRIVLINIQPSVTSYKYMVTV